MIIVKSFKNSHKIARFRYSINNITYLQLQILRNDNFKNVYKYTAQKTPPYLISSMLLYMYLKIKTFTEKIKEDLIHFFNELY